MEENVKRLITTKREVKRAPRSDLFNCWFNASSGVHVKRYKLNTPKLWHDWQMLGLAKYCVFKMLMMDFPACFFALLLNNLYLQCVMASLFLIISTTTVSAELFLLPVSKCLNTSGAFNTAGQRGWVDWLYFEKEGKWTGYSINSEFLSKADVWGSHSTQYTRLTEWHSDRWVLDIVWRSFMFVCDIHLFKNYADVLL